MPLSPIPLRSLRFWSGMQYYHRRDAENAEEAQSFFVLVRAWIVHRSHMTIHERTRTVTNNANCR